MVENNPNSSYFVKLKLKGTEGQTIDLQNLTNLKKTKENEVLFKKFDKDNDGSINKDEAKELAAQLRKAAGNGKISERELNKILGMKGPEAFEALKKLAGQQSAAANGAVQWKDDADLTINMPTNSTKTFNEKTGNYETRFYDADGKLDYIQVTNADNSIADITKYKTENDMAEDRPMQIIKNPATMATREEYNFDYENNTMISTAYKGTELVTSKQNLETEEVLEVTKTTPHITENGMDFENPDSVSTYSSPENFASNTPSQVVNYPNDPAKKETIKYNFDEDGNVTSVTKTKGQTTTTFNSVADMEAGKPSEIKKDTGLDALDRTTTFTEGHGFRTGVEKNALGRPSKVEIKDANGQPVEKMSVDVKEGDTFDKVIDKLIEKYNLPKEDPFIRSFVKKTLVAENTENGLCKQMKSGKYKGNYYFIAGKKAELSTEGLNKILNRDATAINVAPIPFVSNNEPNVSNITPKINSDGLSNFGFKQHRAFQAYGTIELNGETVLLRANKDGQYTIYQDNGSGFDTYIFNSKEQLTDSLGDHYFTDRFGGSKGITDVNNIFIANNDSAPEYRTKVDNSSNTELKTKMEALQQQLGDGFKVELDDNGKVVVKNSEGKVLENATNKARQILTPNKTEDEEDVNAMLEKDKTGNNNNALEIDEYRAFVIDFFQQHGVEIPEGKRESFDKLLYQNFNSMDTINKDGSLSREELLKNAAKAWEEFNNNLEL